MAEINITEQMRKIMEGYEKDVKRATNNSIDVVAKETVSKLKNTSPKRRGDYAKSWGLERERGPAGINTVTVRNKKHYQLTHLLEYGHDVVNAKGKVGRAPAYPHIGPAEEWAINELPREIKKELE